MRERIYQTALDHPLRVLLFGLILILLVGAGAKNLVFKSDYRVFFSDQNPQLTAFERMQKVYSKSDNVAFVITPKSGPLFTPERLAAIHQLTTQSWQIPYSNRVDSITNFQHTYAEQDDLIVADLVLDPDTLDNAQMERLQSIAVAEPLLRNKLISQDGQVTVVNITVQLPGIKPVQEVPEVITQVRKIRDQFISDHPDLQVYLSGMVVMNNSFAEASQNDGKTLIPIMFGVIILTMILLLKTISGTLATVAIILFSIIGTLGLAGWSGFYLTGPSASAPTMVMTLAVADCVHILTSFFYELRHGAEKRAALQTSLRVNFRPIFLTSATTAIGFLSMNFSDSPPFRDLGNMVAVGVMLAFIFSITLFPALLMLLPIKIKPRPEGKNELMETLSHFVINQRRWLLPGMSLLMLAIVFFLPLNKLNDDFVKYFDERVPFRQATDFMQHHLSGLTSMEISIAAGGSGAISEPDYLNTLEAFSQWLRQQPETDHVNTLTDTLKRLNKNMHGDDPEFYRIPASRELAAQYLLLFEMSLPYGLDLNNQLNVDKSSTRIIGTFKNITSNEQIALEQRLYDWFAEHAPQYQVSIASPSLMFSHIGQRNINSMLVGIALALVLISLLLGLALRSTRYGLISLVPNIAPAAMGFGIWFWIDGQVGLALSVVAGMTLGIVVDDTVHFLSKYRHARLDKHLDTTAAVHYAFASVGRALWITTLVLVAGFMVLAQSSFRVNADMGLLTALTILIALIVDFLFLPPLLMRLDRDTPSKGEN